MQSLRENGQSVVSISKSLAIVRDAPGDRPFVVAQLGQSLDGRIATLSGESRWINGNPALDHVHGLRANVDGVLVGVGTAIADDPLLTVRRVAGQNPARIIIDPNHRLPPDARCLNKDGARRIMIRSRAGSETTTHWSADDQDGCETLYVSAHSGHLDPNSIVKGLFDLGLRRILVEGGASTVSTFIDADAVDRLHILIAPVILGSGKPGLQLAPITALAAARRPVTTTYCLQGGEVLFDCDLRRTAHAS